MKGSLFIAISIVSVALSVQVFSCRNRAVPAADPVIVQDTPDHDGLIRTDKSNLEHYREVWLSKKKPNYEYVLATETVGFSPIPTVRITVKNNEVALLRPIYDPKSPAPDLYRSVNTIDRIYELLSKATETNEVKCKFNEEYGYPQAFAIIEKGVEHGRYKATIDDFRFIE